MHKDQEVYYQSYNGTQKLKIRMKNPFKRCINGEQILKEQTYIIYI